ncbi:MAG: hypothetical protein EXR75_02155 [Myxococcales bacterium]|nr:hypothetical protein [Myxococcales bacterium]
MKLKLRRVGPVLYALMTGAVTTAGAGVVATMSVACADEQAAATHVERLSDPIKRTAAVERLLQMYDDKMTVDGSNRDGENVKLFRDTAVPQLAALAEKGDLDSKSQGRLLARLADMRDPRAIPALIKALGDYKMDDKRPDDFDGDIAEIVRNLGEMKTKEAGGAILKIFTEMRASWPKAQNKTFYRTVRDTMLTLQDPAWEEPLIKLLEAEVKSLSNKEQKAIMDQMFWQTVAAELLGNMRSEKAVRPLIKVVLSPFKGPVGVTAISGLIKIGKPAIDAGVKLLNGEDKELAEYAESEFIRAKTDKGDKIDDKDKAEAKKAYVDNAVIIVANIGRVECIAPMLAALEKGDGTSKAVIARELYKLPADPKVIAAFKKVWIDTGLTAQMPPSGNAKEALTEATSSFFDTELAVYVVEQALLLKGEEADTSPIQEVALSMLLKLAGTGQLELLGKVAATEITYPAKVAIGKAFTKEIAIVKKLVGECGKDSACYLKTLASPEASKDSGFLGIKAAYMVASVGGDGTLDKLVEILPSIKNAAVAFTIVQAIDRLSPKGNPAAVAKLQGMIDKAALSRDEAQISKLAPLKTVVFRMRARAQ